MVSYKCLKGNSPTTVIPGQPQRVGASRRPMTGSGLNPESRDCRIEIPGSRFARPGMTRKRLEAMASDQTRTAILAAAERLYADRGFGDVTLRDIVAAADVNLAAVNYHFGSKDELIAELFVTRSIATNRERLNELKAAEEAGGGRAEIDAILRALVGPTLRGCLGPDRERSTAARFMIRASIESVPPIRRIKNREVDHLRKFASAMRRSLPDRDEADLYWGLHFALAMAHHTIRESERLTRLSDGKCDLNDVAGIIERIVAVSVLALTGSQAEKKPAAKLAARDAR